MKIIIIDDHKLVRSGLKQIISEEPGFEVIGEGENFHDAIDLVNNTDADVMLLDISLPGKSGIEILMDVKRIKPKLPVLILSMHPEEQFATRTLRSGASGYLTKETAPEELIIALKKVSQGGKYISRSVAEILAFDIEGRVYDHPHKILSNREFQVFCKLASGKPASAVADELYLSVKTISTYRARILEKMEMRNNAELTFYAVQNQLI
jgi:two-component system, NarL family, invasion response regulator UvrY